MRRKFDEIHYYYDYCNLGGVTSILKQRIALMRKRGIQTRVIMNFLRDLGGRSELEKLEGVTVRLCPTESFRSWSAEQIASNSSALHVLLDQPEVVHILGPAASGVIYEVHTSLEQAFRRMRGVEFSFVAKVICPSLWLQEKLQEVLVGFGTERIRVCPNFVDPAVFRPLESGPGAEGDPILLWVGKLNADKNLTDAFEIIRRLMAKIPLRPVFVTSGGSDRLTVSNLLWRFEAFGLSERARWIVNLSNAEMPRLLADVRASGGLLLSTSKFESFGLAVLEAISCGVPVVGAAVGGLREVIRQGVDGYLYPLTLPEEAVQLAARLLADRAHHAAISSAAVDRASHFAADSAVGAYIRELVD